MVFAHFFLVQLFS